MNQNTVAGFLGRAAHAVAVSAHRSISPNKNAATFGSYFSGSGFLHFPISGETFFAFFAA